MPGPPPPPPPGPPPPSFGGGKPSSGDGRSLLLNSIHQGVQLKKAVTNDRSAPLSGNVKASQNAVRSGSAPPGRSNGGGPAPPITNGGMGGGGMGGLFAGGMPKLRPTGRGVNTGAAPVMRQQESRQQESRQQESRQQEPPSFGGGRRQFPGDVKNRGPPPQPPPATQKPALPTDTKEKPKQLRNKSFKREFSATSLVQQGVRTFSAVEQKPGRLRKGSTSDRPASIIFDFNKPPVEVPVVKKPPRLKKQTSNTSIKSNVSGQSDASVSDSVLHNGPPSLPSKPPVGGYGKPNVAPKPPGAPPNNPRPSPPPKKLVVTRAQSMRAPRSPPVAPPMQPPFPPQPSALHATSGYPSFHQSQDSLSSRSTPPPPRTSTLPNRGRANPVRPPLSRPPPPPSRPPPPPTQAPPPPPHRTQPAPPPPPPPAHNRLAPAPPPTPARNSSMRNGGEGATPGNLERLFCDRFHPVHEFPRPQPFRNIAKVYNSMNVKLQMQTSGKQQAPQPPMLQLGQKMYASESSNC